jgi:L-asparaginase
MKMKNILIIHTGGTFGMNPMKPDKTLHPGELESIFEKYLPMLNEIANIEVKIPFNLDSSDIGPDEWKKTYDIVHENKDNFDGFVIIHGTDTLVYNSTAISFLLADFDKPVIFTGSQRPLSEIRTDAASNLINSVEIATYDINEVGICFGSNLFRANRTKKVSIESYHGFESPNCQPLATIGLNINLNKNLILQKQSNIQLKPFFDSNIINVRVYPGLNPDYYLKMINDKIKAVIIEGFGAGNFPDTDKKWVNFINKCIDAKILVVIGSQSLHGKVDLELYKSAKEAKKSGAISLNDMTFEAALVKLMILFGNYTDSEKIKSIFNSSIAGEVTVN